MEKRRKAKDENLHAGEALGLKCYWLGTPEQWEYVSTFFWRASSGSNSARNGGRRRQFLLGWANEQKRSGKRQKGEDSAGHSAMVAFLAPLPMLLLLSWFAACLILPEKRFCRGGMAVATFISSRAKETGEGRCLPRGMLARNARLLRVAGMALRRVKRRGRWRRLPRRRSGCLLCYCITLFACFAARAKATATGALALHIGPLCWRNLWT